MALPKFNGHLILITGANGYIASQTVKAFLDTGYSVRGTARSFASTQGLLGVLKSYVDAGRFSVVEVKDITADGAFDDAVKGCHGIVHMASPISQFFRDPSIIDTAVKGTTSILASAVAYAKTQPDPPLRSFVLTSSTAAMQRPKDPPYTFTDRDWNDFSPAQVAEKGSEVESYHIYRASKVASEKALWQFRDEHKPSFTVTAINPTWVIGPPLVSPETPDKINETVAPIWKILNGEPIPAPLSGIPGTSSYVDVRDVGRLHVFAVRKLDVADGQRYIACAGLGAEQAIADILRREYVEDGGSRAEWFRGLKDSHGKPRSIEKGSPGEGYKPDYAFGEIVLDGSKAAKDSGLEYTGYETTVFDAAKVFEQYL
ncbi:MAG: hypothetical protein M1820_008346 [Bogoriella megaspora]|nr:MAG: hypothetical protein M1820_008346 [Bogoriella megaspora]